MPITLNCLYVKCQCWLKNDPKIRYPLWMNPYFMEWNNRELHFYDGAKKKNSFNFKLFLQEIYFTNSWFFQIFFDLKLGSFKKLKLYGGQTINFSIFLSCRVISSTQRNMCPWRNRVSRSCDFGAISS